HVAGYEKYFIVKESVEGKVVGVVVDEVAVGVARRYFGFFALLSSSGVLGSVGALELYRNRDLVEKAFGNVKDRLNLRRVLVSSEAGLDGKLFVCYVGLIYLSYIKKHMQTAGLFKDYTLQSLFDRLDVIECFEYPNQSLKAGEITEKQKQLYKCLKVDPPT
ncbi:MAG: transposase, partial [Nitrososphaerota archaeon]|nr:transposase [Nitrososphaerota archaeon]